MKRALTNGGSDKGVSAVVELVVLPGFATLGGCFDTRGNYKMGTDGARAQHSALGTLLGPLARCVENFFRTWRWDGQTKSSVRKIKVVLQR